MDFTFQIGGGRSSSAPGGKNKGTPAGCDGIGGNNSATAAATTAEEYDPSQPLDSSDEEDSTPQRSLNFEKSININTRHPPQVLAPLGATKEMDNRHPLPSRLPVVPPTQPLPPPPSSSRSSGTNNEPDIDLSSIPMPSDEYRRPTIQFSIPTRHRLMSISTLIKRQKGVMRKQDKSGGGLNYNSEVSKAFHKGDGHDSGGDANDPNDDDQPKVSLVHEIFGSDDEDGPQEDETSNTADVTSERDAVNKFGHEDTMIIVPPPATCSEITLEENKWKTVAETVENPLNVNITKSTVPSMNDDDDIRNAVTPPWNEDENMITIKPVSELLEAPGNESSSPEVMQPEEPEEEEEHLTACLEDSLGKENKEIILECVSDSDDDFEVTFVGIGRANLADLRQGRLARRNHRPKKSTSPSPCNGFEEGEIVELDKRRKREKKKKKSKKRKRSKDSRVSSSKMNSDRSAEDSDRKSLSESDNKEVSWRKPKLTNKTRNYRNGKRESEEKADADRGDRTLKRDEPSRRRSRSRSLNRYSSSFHSSSMKSKSSRRRSSISNSRHRSRSKSGSRSPISRRINNRSRRPKRTRRDGSYRSRSNGSNHSSPSHSRSRSLTKRRPKRRHSPSPTKRHRNRSSISVSPVRPAESPRPRKRNRSVEGDKHDKSSARLSPPASSHGNRKLSKSDPPPAEETKKKVKKDKVVTEEVTDKEKKKKRKRREKSISPVKAIVADGDSIVVSLSFQKAKEEPPKPSKSSSSTSSAAHSNTNNAINNNRSSETETRGGSSGSNNTNNTDTCDEIEAPIANYKATPRKGTILINLDASPSRGGDKDLRKSPDGSKSEENKSDRDQSSKKSQEDKKNGQDRLESDSETVNCVDRLDFVSSSHENSVDNNTHSSSASLFSASTPKKSSESPSDKAATSASASRSPYKFGEFFVSSTESKSLSPVVEPSSPKSNKATSELPESSSLSQKSASRNSPFQNLRSVTLANDTERLEKAAAANKSPSPEILSSSTPLRQPSSTPSSSSSSSATIKPMIGNIPGLFPSGFSSSGLISTPSVIIPAPPKIVPNSTPTSLINNLVSVASALYAPLLAAKQPNAGPSINSGSSRHNQSNNNSINLSSVKHGRPNNGMGGEGDSPFSPNSSDGDDLFEPPSQGEGNHGKDQGISNNKKNPDQSHRSSGNIGGNAGNSAKYDGGMDKRSLFDTLFTPSNSQKSSITVSSKLHGGKLKKASRDNKRSKHKRSSKRTEADKNGEMEMNSRLNEEVPNSAVALKINEKYLKKLNRQERVVEEVKLSLKPHYVKKHITKEEYKDILRKAVPKICHNKSGEINPHKIKELVEAYVKKYRKTRKVDSKAA